MRVTFFSDTHEKHEQVRIAPTDLLLFCGDMTMDGDIQKLREFTQWMSWQECQAAAMIPGNHDRTLEPKPFPFGDHDELLERIRDTAHDAVANTSIEYLEHSETTLLGLRIFGSPWTPIFNSDYWRFHYHRLMAETLWREIPEGLDILLTHGPLNGILDRTLENTHAGCEYLYRRVRVNMKNPPRVHCCGHIHEGYGVKEIGDSGRKTTFLNASILDRFYKVSHRPIVWDTEENTFTIQEP